MELVIFACESNLPGQDVVGRPYVAGEMLLYIHLLHMMTFIAISSAIFLPFFGPKIVIKLLSVSWVI